MFVLKYYTHAPQNRVESRAIVKIKVVVIVDLIYNTTTALFAYDRCTAQRNNRGTVVAPVPVRMLPTLHQQKTCGARAAEANRSTTGTVRQHSAEGSSYF